MLPPSVISPVTSKSPVINVLFCKLIAPLAEVIFKLPVILSTVFPLTRILPVSIFVGVIVVVFTPLVNVAPDELAIFNVCPLNNTSPVFWFT